MLPKKKKKKKNAPEDLQKNIFSRWDSGQQTECSDWFYKTQLKVCAARRKAGEDVSKEPPIAWLFGSLNKGFKPGIKKGWATLRMNNPVAHLLYIF